MKNLIRSVAPLAAFFVASCFSVGQRFDFADVDALVPNVSTIDDAKKSLGEPSADSCNADGSHYLQWLFIEGGPLSNGNRDGHVGILFDKHGLMVRVAYRSSIR